MKSSKSIIIKDSIIIGNRTYQGAENEDPTNSKSDYEEAKQGIEILHQLKSIKGKDTISYLHIKREEELLEEILCILKTRNEEEKLNEIIRILKEIVDESDNEETLREKLNRILILQPNIGGLGFNFNEAIKLYFRWNGKNK